MADADADADPGPGRPGRSLRGVAAVVLAVGVVAVLVLAEVYVFVHPRSQPADTADITIVAGVVGAMVGALATYMGNRPDT